MTKQKLKKPRNKHFAGASENKTSVELSKALEEIGRKMSPDRIRQLWCDGAPHDYEGFLKLVEKKSLGAKGIDAEIKAKRLEKLDREIAVLRQTESRAKRRNQKEDSEVIDSKIAEQGAGIATQTFFAGLEEIKRDLPPLLEGRDALFIRLKLDERFKELEKKTSEAFGLILKTSNAKS